MVQAVGKKVSFMEYNPVTMRPRVENTANVIEIPQTTKILPCGKCGRDLTVPTRTVLAYCQNCSANLGVKR
jgi:hypothetical protein